jgi:hypothetical protein
MQAMLREYPGKDWVRLADSGGGTALHYASLGNHDQAVELLLSLGADAACADHALHTPLHAACAGGALDAARLLIGSGAADVGAPNSKLETPLDLAVATGEDRAPGLIACLCLAGADASDALRHVFGGGGGGQGAALSSATARALLRNGAKPNLPVPGGGGELSSPGELLLGRPGGLSEAEVGLLVVLAGAGARLPPKATAKLHALTKVALEAAAVAWATEALAAKRGTVMARRQGWVPDKDSTTCQSCDAKFTTLSRRHHCRFCAELVCGACSSRRLAIAAAAEKPERACDRCFNREGESEAVASARSTSPLSPLVSPTKSGGGADGMAASPGGKGQAASPGSGPTSPMADAKQQLQQNVDTARRVEDKSANLKSSLANFAANSKLLAEQAKKK